MSKISIKYKFRQLDFVLVNQQNAFLYCTFVYLNQPLDIIAFVK